jgi:hypothetical protein
MIAGFSTAEPPVGDPSNDSARKKVPRYETSTVKSVSSAATIKTLTENKPISNDMQMAE